MNIFSSGNSEQNKLEKERQRLIEETTLLQATASDPERSVWVSANAGTGKTHVLVNRVLRILLTGVPPERILCLTYTKAAAAEMSNRLFRKLSNWAIMDELILAEELTHLVGKAPRKEEIARARTLFATTMETPGNLKVQTIHAFCERVLNRFPLEAGISPHSTMLDEVRAKAIQKDCLRVAMDKAIKAPHSQLGLALHKVLDFAADKTFVELMEMAISKKSEILNLFQQYSHVSSEPGHVFKAAFEDFLVAFGLDKTTTLEQMDAVCANILNDGETDFFIDTLSGGSTNDLKAAERFRQIKLADSPMKKAQAIFMAFMTTNQEPRARVGTNAVNDTPGFVELVEARQSDVVTAREQRSLVGLKEVSQALFTVAAEVIGEYERIKSVQAWLDFDDLIDKTGQLLIGKEAADWVLYKLDGGLDHILVDEAQDTSPGQWAIVDRLSLEFFAGEGARHDNGKPRTVFAVGDEKQSIYSFQGAVPAEFARMGNYLGEQIKEAGKNWNVVPLTLNFRSTSAILDGVDRVFKDREKVPGISFTEEDIRHDSARIGEAGFIELWPVEQREVPETVDVWQPEKDVNNQESPAAKLAKRIAERVRYWLDNKVLLASKGRPIRPGDILILVKNRHPFAPQIIRSLKNANIPVAGADRMRITDQIAIQDLIALGDTLLLPLDDLSLACVLKSPLFELNDNDLFTLGHERQGTLWQALKNKTKDSERFRFVYEKLTYWRDKIDELPPFEFYSYILGNEKGREKFLGRLGPEAADALDEFLNLALGFDADAPSAMQLFLETVRQGETEIKRDMDQVRDEVRVMTVHGSKGLEAEIVFLPDTMKTRSSRTPILSIEPEEFAATQPVRFPLWNVSAFGMALPLIQAKAKVRAAEIEEYNRLLYVAMTRAKDQLIVCGWSDKKPSSKDEEEGGDAKPKLPEGCWYELIQDGLGAGLKREQDETGREVFRFESQQVFPVQTEIEDKVASKEQLPRPYWIDNNVDEEMPPARKLTPSKLLTPGLANDLKELAGQFEDEEPSSIVSQGDLFSGLMKLIETEDEERGDALLRGTLTHALLEHLPQIEPRKRKAAADRLLGAYGQDLSSREQKAVWKEVRTILDNEDLAYLFDRNSQAEVNILVEVPSQEPEAPPYIIDGQIDRLVIEDNRVLIIDYKTNQKPPANIADIDQSYILQLAMYKTSMDRIMPGKPVHAGLLWTSTAQISWFSPEKLELYQQGLFENMGMKA